MFFFFTWRGDGMMDGCTMWEIKISFFCSYEPYGWASLENVIIKIYHRSLNEVLQTKKNSFTASLLVFALALPSELCCRLRKLLSQWQL